MTVPTRRIGPFGVFAIGLGCMSLSHAYGTPPSPEAGTATLHAALDAGYTFFDTAALYGDGANEALIGATFGGKRAGITVATKCGMTIVGGKRVIDGRPATLLATIDASLARLRVEVIDLLYLHRWDKAVPIEDSVGAMGEAVAAGKIRALGLSEVSAATLARAHAIHPITAVQSEYSLWTRDPENGVLAECRRVGAALVPFSPLGRGFLGGGAPGPDALDPKDIRRAMPRFQAEAHAANAALFARYAALADRAGCTPGQLALAWLLAQGPDIVPIPATTRAERLTENIAAAALAVDPAILAEAAQLVTPAAITGARYNPATLAEIDA